MTDEFFFQFALDMSPDDSGARLLFAEWLADGGDERSAGYRFMAEQVKRPFASMSTWEWWQDVPTNPPEIRLAEDLWQALPVAPAVGYPRCKEWASRSEAEEALCQLLLEKPVSFENDVRFSNLATADMETSQFPTYFLKNPRVQGRK